MRQKALADDFTPGFMVRLDHRGPSARPGHGARLRRGTPVGARPSTLSARRAGSSSNARTSRASSASGKTKPGSASASRADDAAASAAARTGAARRERARLWGSAPGGLFREVSAADAGAAVEAGLAAGVTYFDTAPLYGHRLSEHRLGPGAPRGSPTTRFVLLHEGRATPPADPRRPAAGRASSRMPFRSTTCTTTAGDGARRWLEDSLQRLGLARIDHRPGSRRHPLARHGADYERRFRRIHGGRVPGARQSSASPPAWCGHRRRRERLGRLPRYLRAGDFDWSCWQRSTRSSARTPSRSSCPTAPGRESPCPAAPFNSGPPGVGRGARRAVPLRAGPARGPGAHAAPRGVCARQTCRSRPRTPLPPRRPAVASVVAGAAREPK